MYIISKSKEHVASVEESYLKHMCFALKYSMLCFKAALMVLVHAFVPALFITSASDLVKKLAMCVAKGERDQL